jgi:hypothetical protein
MSASAAPRCAGTDSREPATLPGASPTTSRRVALEGGAFRAGACGPRPPASWRWSRHRSPALAGGPGQILGRAPLAAMPAGGARASRGGRAAAFLRSLLVGPGGPGLRRGSAVTAGAAWPPVPGARRPRGGAAGGGLVAGGLRGRRETRRPPRARAAPQPPSGGRRGGRFRLQLRRRLLAARTSRGGSEPAAPGRANAPGRRIHLAAAGCSVLEQRRRPSNIRSSPPPAISTRRSSRRPSSKRRDAVGSGPRRMTHDGRHADLRAARRSRRAGSRSDEPSRRSRRTPTPGRLEGFQAGASPTPSPPRDARHERRAPAGKARSGASDPLAGRARRRPGPGLRAPGPAAGAGGAAPEGEAAPPATPPVPPPTPHQKARTAEGGARPTRGPPARPARSRRPRRAGRPSGCVGARQRGARRSRDLPRPPSTMPACRSRAAAKQRPRRIVGRARGTRRALGAEARAVFHPGRGRAPGRGPPSPSPRGLRRAGRPSQRAAANRP